MSRSESTSGQDDGDLGELVLDATGKVGQKALLERTADLPHGEPMQNPPDPVTDQELRVLLLKGHLVSHPATRVGEPVDAGLLGVEVEGTGTPLGLFEKRIIDECAARAAKAAQTK